MRKGKLLESVVRQYGQRVTVYPDEGSAGVGATAIIQPIMDERRRLEQYTPTPLGYRRADRFLYLGEPGVALNAEGAMRIALGGQRFRVQSAHPVYVGRTQSHWWAVLYPEDEVTE